MNKNTLHIILTSILGIIASTISPAHAAAKTPQTARIRTRTPRPSVAAPATRRARRVDPLTSSPRMPVLHVPQQINLADRINELWDLSSDLLSELNGYLAPERKEQPSIEAFKQLQDKILDGWTQIQMIQTLQQFNSLDETTKTLANVVDTQFNALHIQAQSIAEDIEQDIESRARLSQRPAIERRPAAAAVATPEEKDFDTEDMLFEAEGPHERD